MDRSYPCEMGGVLEMNVERYDPLQGFECENEPQSGWICQDYKVRYKCPQSFCNISVLSNVSSEVKNITAISLKL
ncbi:hypothetical protein DPX16_20558 [Anabarilius grahami]|uniref:WxxW domain-containing protein n=1 Tax=Anabarilius grahami TaxID=495550 RepID=A0A3N0YL51_ANAGA|nr:hypothetical protein DPX16_20558 [Anabarilius grahami]